MLRRILISLAITLAAGMMAYGVYGLKSYYARHTAPWRVTVGDTVILDGNNRFLTLTVMPSCTVSIQGDGCGLATTSDTRIPIPDGATIVFDDSPSQKDDKQ